MASQTLQTIIAINAKVGNGFSEVGATLTELGSLVNGMSQKLIDFGKESVDVYRDYEKSMKDAEVALSTHYGRNTRELAAVMDGLNASATEWAATTIFHTDDVANAISEAAHAGWDYEQIMSGIPAAMQLAQAGGLDLSEAVNYIVKSTNAAGIEFQDLGRFIDLWTYAANSSASTVGEFGEAMLRMGATMRFTDSTEELMTLIAVTANAGSVGSEAGTMIRNSIMRLAAPTDAAQEVMEQLGATTEETAEIMNDEAMAAANARLAAQGFSAYDEHGDLKSVLDIYRELYVALGEIAGGYENIEDNEDAIAILHGIFKNRSITEALALIRAAGDGYDDLYEKMTQGEAEGYGEYAAATMMDSLDGRIETFESKVERLKQVVGESISDELSDVLGTIGGMVDNIAELDTGQLDALVGAAEVLAGVGPGLMMAGGAFRLIGTLFNGPTLIAGLTTVGMLAAAVYASRIAEQNYADAFGNLSIDSTELTTAVGEIQTAFDEAYADVHKFNDELRISFEKYQTAGGEFKESLIGKMVTGATLTDTDIKNLNTLGEDMISAVEDGIDNSYAAKKASIIQSMTGGEEDVENPIMDQIMDVMMLSYEEELAQAQQIGQSLRDAMLSAFEDGTLDQQEIDNIQSVMDQMNELYAKQIDRQNFIEQQRILKKGQTLGLEGVREAAELIGGERDRELTELAVQQAAALYDTEHYYDEAIEKGWEVDNLDGSGTHVATEADKTRALEELSAAQTEETYSVTAGLNELMLRTLQEAVNGSDVKDVWDSMKEFGQDFRENGGVVSESALNAYLERTKDAEGQTHAVAFLQEAMEALGGRELAQGYADYFSGIGDEESAQRYRDLISMYDLFGGGEMPVVGQQTTEGYTPVDMYQAVSDALTNNAQEGQQITPEELAAYVASQKEQGIEPQWSDYLSGNIYRSLNESAQAMGMTLSDYILTAVPDWQSQVQPTQPTIENAPAAVESAPAQETEAGVTAKVDVDPSQITSTLDAINAELTAQVNGDTTELQNAISAEDGKTITTNVAANTSAIDQALASYSNRTITVNIAGRKLFAHGGRATEASVFGEAGAEWAIPEEHSENTAELLNAAREASGFTWPDLLERYGGLNADTSSRPVVLNYSPTINAGDASGVEEALQNDKDRLNKWFEEKQMRDKMEVYA